MYFRIMVYSIINNLQTRLTYMQLYVIIICVYCWTLISSAYLLYMYIGLSLSIMMCMCINVINLLGDMLGYHVIINITLEYNGFCFSGVNIM